MDCLYRNVPGLADEVVAEGINVRSYFSYSFSCRIIGPVLLLDAHIYPMQILMYFIIYAM